MILYSAMSLMGMVWINAGVEALPGTQPLTMEGDLAAQMVEGIGEFFDKETQTAVAQRSEQWNPDFSSHESYVASLQPNRERLMKIIGADDPREAVEMHLDGTVSHPALVGEGQGYKIFAVRWDVLPGVDGEGLLLQPDGDVSANIVALPDCDWTPEMLSGLTSGVPESAQSARRLAENGTRVLIPLLMNREETYSGHPDVRMTNQPHREFIYRAAYELGRHIIGYEVQKVIAGVDWFKNANPNLPVGVIGYGEGGLIAFYSGAIDTRIDAVGVSGYFQPRENLWREPIYRNVWGLIDQFGDAEITSLIAPRSLIIEASPHPEISGPPDVTEGRNGGAAPGELTTPPFESVEAEFRRAQQLTASLQPAAPLTLVKSDSPGSDAMLGAFLKSLSMEKPLTPSGIPPKHHRPAFDPAPRLKRQFDQLMAHTQHLMHEAEFRRVEFWSKADDSSVEAWTESSRWYREYFWDEVVGRSPVANVPINPRTRPIYETPAFTGYEVVLDVYPDVFAYGILLLPKDIAEGERRPVVVCQHGLEGRPQDVANPDEDNAAYHRYACRLAERGFVTYAPQNPYIGGNTFRQLVRMGHPLKQSLYSIIVRQHEQTLEWLASQPFVDAERIAFYGLSYGGKAAMRIPSILEGYCLSICSADYNEWVWKNVSNRHTYSYMFGGEYDMYEFDLGNTFNYAEMSWLVCPRPFMVERGHHDGVAPDEWVAYEYAKTQRRYDLLDIGNRAEMEVFNGPHTIHGVGTFEFLHQHLNWRKR
jgi:dienelactone hydrolase